MKNVIDGMFYEIKGTGKPIIFLHGIGSSHSMFHPQVEALSKEYMTIAVDLKGSGSSASLTKDSCAKKTHVSSILTLMNHLGLTSASFVGVSYGGIITQMFAIQHPDKVESMVLIDTYANTVPKTKEEYALIALGVVLGVASWLPGRVASKLCTPFKRWDLAYNELLHAARQKRRGKETTMQLMEVFRMNLLDNLKKLDIPSLVMVGDYVPGIVKKSQEIARHLKNSEFVVIQNAVDPSNLCQPEFVNRTIGAFFEKVNMTPCKQEKVPLT